MTALPRFVTATAMRNEGAFVVEWVTWYRMLGFEVVVATNDCTDRSPALLDALAAAGWVTHLPHVVSGGVPPQKAAHAVLHAHPQVRSADWVLVCDVDEFLVLHQVDDILHFVGTGPWDYLGVAFNWKCFGSGGWQRYKPGLVHQQFLRCGIGGLKINTPVKSMFRRPEAFARLGAHAPHGFKGDWAAHENAWLGAGGVELAQYRDLAAHPIRRTTQDQIDHSAAQMNHYILRSEEQFAAKKGTPAAANGEDRYTDGFFRRHDKNGMKDESALRFADRFAALHAEAMALPGVAALHHLCCADHIEALCAAQGVDHRVDDRWIDAMTLAG